MGVVQDGPEQVLASPKPNMAIRAWMGKAGVSIAELTDQTDFSQRTIQRWLDGTSIPHPSNARDFAHALGCEPSDLWPDRYPILNPPSDDTIAVSVYPSRARVPAAAWTSHFSAAQRNIDILVYGGTFLFDQVPEFEETLRDAAERGVIVRFLTGDSGSAAVRERGIEERIGDGLPGRCRMTLSRLEPLQGVEGIAVRVHATTLYVSMFRADEVLIANHHIHGEPASNNPSLLLNRDDDRALWNRYEKSFARIWTDARPVPGHHQLAERPS